MLLRGVVEQEREGDRQPGGRSVSTLEHINCRAAAAAVVGVSERGRNGELLSGAA